MTSSALKLEKLEGEIKQLESELNDKRRVYQELKRQIANCPSEGTKHAKDSIPSKYSPSKYPIQSKYSCIVSTEEISRYSRQMLVPSIGPEGQLKLKNSRVLIVGTGGLGCPSALYLAAAGIGQITLVDMDQVEVSNLHRQILHFEGDVNKSKVESAMEKLSRLNSAIEIIPIAKHVDSSTITDILSSNAFDVVIDGTDNVATRYLLNDACVLNKIPLVSGSALQLEGQLTVYNYRGGPCYRCLFPVPPPPESVTSCGDGGVLGVVPGAIGILQALETIKIVLAGDPSKDSAFVSSIDSSASIGSPPIVSSPPSMTVLAGRLLTFDAADTTFRNIKLRTKDKNCQICGDNPTILDLIDYEQFCGAKAHDKVENISILKPQETIGVSRLFQSHTPTNEGDGNERRILLDVRPEIEYRMGHLPESLNTPYSELLKGKHVRELEDIISRESGKDCVPVYVICRRGNDSQRAVTLLRDTFFKGNDRVMFVNVTGGLHSYAKHVDGSFPIY